MNSFQTCCQQEGSIEFHLLSVPLRPEFAGRSWGWSRRWRDRRRPRGIRSDSINMFTGTVSMRDPACTTVITEGIDQLIVSSAKRFSMRTTSPTLLVCQRTHAAQAYAVLWAIRESMQFEPIPYLTLLRLVRSIDCCGRKGLFYARMLVDGEEAECWNTAADDC